MDMKSIILLTKWCSFKLGSDVAAVVLVNLKMKNEKCL